MISPKITNLGYSNLWSDMSTILGYSNATFEGLIVSLFSDNEQGFFYDPNDLTTMFQDAAGIVPVTAVGQSVGLIRDKSGNNNHAFQTASASRPILRKNAVTDANYLEFDGSDDFLRTNNIDFTATDKMSLFAGLNRTGNANVGTVLETGSSFTNPTGGFGIKCPVGVGTSTLNLLASAGGSSVSTGEVVSPNMLVYSGFIDLSKTTAIKQINFKVNGVLVNTTRSSSLAGNGNLANVPVYIGRRAGVSRPFKGHIYGLIGVGKLTSDDEVINIEKELAKRIGVTLNV